MDGVGLDIHVFCYAKARACLETIKLLYVRCRIPPYFQKSHWGFICQYAPGKGRGSSSSHTCVTSRVNQPAWAAVQRSARSRHALSNSAGSRNGKADSAILRPPPTSGCRFGGKYGGEGKEGKLWVDLIEVQERNDSVAEDGRQWSCIRFSWDEGG